MARILGDGERRRSLIRGPIGALFLGILYFCLPQGLHPTSTRSLSTVHAEEQSFVTGELIVFAAASLTAPFTEIGKRLELSHPGLKVVYNFGGSQMLRVGR